MGARVVDASALAALLFGEPQAAEVAEILGSSPLAAPSLLRYELGSVCLKKIRRYPGQQPALLSALRHAERLAIEEFDVPQRSAVELAEATKLSVYDSSYLWLALELGTRLVTLDSKLGAVARGLSV